MIGLVACIAAALILVLVFRQRPVVWVSAGILTAILFPTVATRAWLFEAGDLSRIHPSTWIFLMGFLVTMVFSPVKIAVPRIRTAVILAIGLWTAITGLIVIKQSGSGSVGAFVVYYLTPPIAFLAIHAVVTRQDSDLWRKIVPVVLTAASVETALALLQYLTHTSVLFGQYYATNYWWEGYLDRALGTFDNPLDLAAFLTMAIPLTAALRRTPAVFVLAGLFATGVVVTGSRTGIVLAAVVFVWIVLARSRNVFPAVMASVTVGLGDGNSPLVPACDHPARPVWISWGDLE